MPFGDEDTPELADEVAPVQDGADGDVSESTGAESSDAPGETEDQGLLGVLRDAVAEKKPEAEAASPADGEEEKGDEPDEDPKKQDDEGYTDVPFNKHPRFRQLLTERNSFKHDAEQYRTVQNFINEQGLTSEEAADLLVIGAMGKTNPAKAWELARPWVENVLKAAGEVLSDDLAQMVRDGAMTRDAAFEVSRARAQVASSEAARGFEQQRAQQRQEEEYASSLKNAATTWESVRRERDPNFEAKVKPILREIAYRRMQGDVPKTPQEVEAQLNDVYKAVNAELAPPVAPPVAAQPPRREIKPVTGGSVAGSARPAPRNMLEVVQQASAGA